MDSKSNESDKKSSEESIGSVVSPSSSDETNTVSVDAEPSSAPVSVPTVSSGENGLTLDVDSDEESDDDYIDPLEQMMIRQAIANSMAGEQGSVPPPPVPSNPFSFLLSGGMDDPSSSDNPFSFLLSGGARRNFQMFDPSAVTPASALAEANQQTGSTTTDEDNGDEETKAGETDATVEPVSTADIPAVAPVAPPPVPSQSGPTPPSTLIDVPIPADLLPHTDSEPGEDGSDNEDEDDSNDESESDSDNEGEPIALPPILQMLMGGGPFAGGPFGGGMGPAGQVVIPMGGPFGISMGSSFGSGINYYANANPEFKEIIGDDEKGKHMYNVCSRLFMGHNRDFVGWYTEKMLHDINDILDNHYHQIIARMQDDTTEFFDTVYVPIIVNLHANHMKKRRQIADKTLDNFTHELLSGSESKGDCVICICPIDEGKYVDLPCTHIFHHECTATWFCEKSECPTCRKSFVEATLDDIVPTTEHIKTQYEETKTEEPTISPVFTPVDKEPVDVSKSTTVPTDVSSDSPTSPVPVDDAKKSPPESSKEK